MTTTQGVLERRLDTRTASRLPSSPTSFFHHLVSGLNCVRSFFSSFLFASSSPSLRSSFAAFWNFTSS